ncbi:hypothetical protein IFM89_011273 [Coptis chinensis]|uniref:Uncharacterized protein n=1 Tax=Coptis chinensis TaxID=261450 RepID=A0A835HBU7_9MAGN|nr:hypothetical protein IFM89_011273 [Coptis chinensis]
MYAMEEILAVSIIRACAGLGYCLNLSKMEYRYYKAIKCSGQLVHLSFSYTQVQTIEIFRNLNYLILYKIDVEAMPSLHAGHDDGRIRSDFAKKTYESSDRQPKSPNVSFWIEEAQEVFDSISEMNLISWNAMISGLVMEGKQHFDSMTKDHEDAKKMIDEIPMVEACLCAWGALLSACRTHDDTNHPQINDVRRKLEELLKKIEDTGDYINKNGSEESRGYHSEKLAVAFGLLSLPGCVPVHVMKNLRV